MEDTTKAVMKVMELAHDEAIKQGGIYYTAHKHETRGFCHFCEIEKENKKIMAENRPLDSEGSTHPFSNGTF